LSKSIDSKEKSALDTISKQSELIFEPKLKDIERRSSSNIVKISTEINSRLDEIGSKFDSKFSEIRSEISRTGNAHEERIQDIEQSLIQCNETTARLDASIAELNEKITTEPSAAAAKQAINVDAQSKDTIEKLSASNKLKEQAERNAKLQEENKKLRAEKDARDSDLLRRRQEEGKISPATKPPAKKTEPEKPSAKPAAAKVSSGGSTNSALSIPPSGLRPRVILLHRPTLPSSAR